ncbi:protein PSK SIMULATOR 2 [Mercurialis annua]|uniref:protein PSK SIMULATOR 2 n=1 Tax=Mercurialis annua TaxID=3986 RepID=UPI00215E0222|nr:protein PSK SIMULATOR 2 [Mercurialis annua]XP_050213725.1 protein PSK SIMULATOR 2 [Mercurialis annua]XP_055960361.1 protein PSK SIMULATOR 2 [Mercurialis annua]
MGAVCPGGTKSKPKHVNKVGDGENNKTAGFSGKLKSIKSFTKKKQNSPSNNITTTGTAANKDEYDDGFGETLTRSRYNSGELLNFSRELKPSAPARGGIVKDIHKSSFIEKAGAVSLEKAVEVLDTLGSSMSNLNARGGFVSGMASRGHAISILAFEVANTIAKGANLFQSLSDENVKILKKEILHSKGVRQLVSTDMKELLCIAASDKREELDVFAKEVIRFGDRCKDPQWHNLSRFFSKLDSEYSTYTQSKEESEMTMQELTTLAHHTSELYHELNGLDRFEQDFKQKLEEAASLHLPKKGESLYILQREIKEQRKLVRSLRRKSLWSKSLEEVMEKFVDVVTYLHQRIIDAFGNNGAGLASERPGKKSQRLGAAGLALHYANVVHQIDNIASRPTSLPPNTRDSFYHGLPLYVKTAMRSRLQMIDDKEELTVTQAKAEMEKILHWLVPVATSTTKAHQGFGWVGEWANVTTQNNLIRLQTLYHADIRKTDEYILELVMWLHRLINLVRHRDHELRATPFRSPTRKGLVFLTKMQRHFSINHYSIQLSEEDRDILNRVCKRRLVPGISKSQEFSVAKKKGKLWALNRSTGSSPVREVKSRQNLDPRNMLDVMDGLHFTL